jgi:hypothetical protein
LRIEKMRKASRASSTTTPAATPTPTPALAPVLRPLLWFREALVRAEVGDAVDDGPEGVCVPVGLVMK